MSDVKEALKDKYHDVVYWFRDLRTKLRRLYRWLPILWNDRDYDYSAVYKVLGFKLKQLRLHISEHKFFEGYEDVAKDIEHTETLINRLYEDDYLKQEWEAYMTKYPFLGRSNEYIPRSEDARAESKKLFEQEDHSREKDLLELSDILRTKLSRWWC